MLVSVANGKWGGNNSNGFEYYRTENGSNQGRNLALTGLCVPRSVDNCNEGVCLSGGPLRCGETGSCFSAKVDRFVLQKQNINLMHASGERERVLHWQPTGSNPLYHRDG